jgi:hypothetical protein
LQRPTFSIWKKNSGLLPVPGIYQAENVIIEMMSFKNHRRMQHFLYFFPLPQGHGSFLPMLRAFVYPARVVTICLCRYSG